MSDAGGSKGLATAVGAGSTPVSATFDGVTGVTTLTVTEATLASIEVTPANPSIADGTTVELTATGVYSDDSTQDLTTQVTWASSDGAVATVSDAGDSKGLATAVGAGSTPVSATFDGVTGVTTLTVTEATLASIEVTPANPSIADGTTVELTATGVYSDDSTQDLTEQVTWASSNDEVATMSNADPKGLATAVDPGSATVSAIFDGVTGDTTLTVTNATLVSIEVTPANASIADGTTLAAQGDRRLHGRLDAGPHGAGDLGLVQRRGGDGEHRRPEGPRDRGRCRQRHRVCNLRRSDRRHDVDGDRSDPGVD